MANEEEKLLEEQLQLQLHDQRESLASIEEALLSDASNSDLLAVHEELVEAIKDAEEGLFHLKRARLLREADSVLDSFNHTSAEVKAEPLDPSDVEPEPLEDKAYSIGAKCRFRYTDGRWYNGQIIGFEASDSAKISFLTPTSENMLMCKFFLQERCRFGSNCRSSHGVDVPLSSLRKYIPTVLEQSLVGSSIWAVSGSKDGLWREAELESWDDELRAGQVIFRDDGSSSRIGMEDITLSEHAHMSSEEGTDSGSEQSGSSDYEEESPEGLGFLDSAALQKGIQTDTALFAKWENHTRGVASKMMANMGYREGMGLGVSGQGMLDPISVKVLPAKQSLDHALESREGEEKRGKKRSRGGARKLDKKFAAAARAAKAKVECRPDVFSLINSRLAKSGASNGASTKKQQNKGAEGEKKVDRRALVAYDHEVRDLKTRVEKLEEMVNRNRNEKPVYEAAMRKLNETRTSLAEVMAAHASASNAVVSREKEKRWLKF